MILEHLEKLEPTLDKKKLFTPSGLLSTGFYSGLFPIAPGTAGSLSYLILFLLGDLLFGISLLGYLVVTASLVIFGYFATRNTLLAFPDLEDPKFVVVDEWIGLHLALFPLMIGYTGSTSILLAFVLFRFFDATKLSIVRWAENLPGAWGVIADDIVAGIIAAALTILAFS